MSILLNIDTSEIIATVCIAEDGNIIALQKNEVQNNHAAFLHSAIKKLLADLEHPKIDGVAVVAGPGSYTGLRVGMSAAKGLCYALNIPLITLNSLNVLAHAALLKNPGSTLNICPMIDARRMEVFTALFNPAMEELISPKAQILNEDFIQYVLSFSENTMFTGSGSSKILNIYPFSKLQVQEFSCQIPASIAKLSYSNFYESKFANLALSEPFYLKEFYGK